MTYSEIESTEFDVCVVGAGAGGGAAALELCRRGAKVCVLEIGDHYLNGLKEGKLCV